MTARAPRQIVSQNDHEFSFYGGDRIWTMALRPEGRIPSASTPFGFLRQRNARPNVGAGGGKRTALSNKEPIGGNTQGGMMVESPPASDLKMTKADFFFEFLVVALNAQPKLCLSYQPFK